MPDARFLDASDGDVRTAWADLLARSEQATPFSTLAYAAAVREVLGYPFRLAGVMEDERLVAGVLLFERPLGPYRMVVVPPFTPYTTLLFDPPLRETDVNQRRSAVDALAGLVERRYHEAALHLHPSVTDVRGFTWADWTATPFYTHHVALQPDRALTRSWSSTTRNVFRNEEGYRFVDGAPAGEVARLTAASYERHERRPPVPASTLRTFLQRLQREGVVELCGARPKDGGPFTSAVALAMGHGTAYYWIAGSVPGLSMTVLIGTLLHRLRERETCTRFDFVGANTPSIAEFKRKFGSELVPYFRVEKHMRPELRLLQSLRRLMAR